MKKAGRSKLNKGILIPLIAVLVLAAAFGGARAIRHLRARAYVLPVETLNMPYFAEPMSMDGFVYDTDSQNVYISPTQVITDVLVEEGQSVSAGDKLLAMDITGEEITLKMMEIQVLRAQNDLENARAELYRLQHTTPVEKKPETPDTQDEPTGDRARIGEAWNYLDGTAVNDYIAPDPNASAPHGSLENPIRYMVTADGLVYGSFLNAVKAKYPTSYIVIEVREGNLSTGDLVASWTVYAGELKDAAEGDHWSVLNRVTSDPSFELTPIRRGGWIDDGSGKGGKGGNSGGSGGSGGSGSGGSGSGGGEETYTPEELAQAIRAAEINVRSCDIALRRAQLELSRQKEQTGDGGIYALSDGMVTLVGDPEKPPQDGSPFLTVSAGQGVFVKGSVSELALDKLLPGQEITAMSWETGETYYGKVSSVDDYPANSEGYYGGNQNVSYYSFLAELEGADSLSTGMYLQISVPADTEDTGSIYLMSAYIRSDAGGKYVMADEGGSLVKRYIKCGKTYYGEITEVREGLSLEDYISFPYGNGAEEGTRTEIAESEEVFW